MDIPPHELVPVIERALEGYLSRRRIQRQSIPSLAARILFEMLRDDFRALRLDERRKTINKSRLRHKIQTHSDWNPKKDIDPHSFVTAPRDLASQLENFRHPDDAAGSRWIFSFSLPACVNSNPGDDDCQLWLELACTRVGPITAPVHVSESMPVNQIELTSFLSRCVCCGDSHRPFSASNRACGNAKCISHTLGVDDRDRYVFRFPEPAPIEPGNDIQRYDRHHFATFNGTEDDERALELKNGTPNFAYHFPYKHDALLAAGLQLGSPVLHRLRLMQTWSRFRNLFALDMSTYHPSNTLKDPKSWAVVNVALEHDISTLVVYTAGNAGLSLAKLVSEANRRLDAGMRVHALIEEELSVGIRQYLRGWGAELDVLESSAKPRTQTDVLGAFYDRIDTATVHQSGRRGIWHVSEGWDGVGVLMYRALFADLLSRVQVDYLVVPVGQGNLFLGAYMGREDARSVETILVGAIPNGESILQAPHSLQNVVEEMPEMDRAIAPKLAGRNSPLAHCILHLKELPSVRFVGVTQSMQRAVAAKGIRQRLATEPSALLTLAALRDERGNAGLAEQLRHGANRPPGESTVVVVNSGLGLLNETEAQFLAEWA